MSSRPVTVIGGGVAGLSAAFDLASAGADVTVLEADDRFGGKVWSSPVGDRVVDAGADTFLARVPHGTRLCADLGLADELTSPIAPVPAYLCRENQLRPLPAGTILGVPTDFEELSASGAVSADAVAAAKAELSRAGTEMGEDISVGAYFRDRLGDEITDRLVDPLIGGINASDIDRLSLRAAAPQIAAVAEKHRSIIEGLREARATVGATLGSAGRPGSPDSAPVFHGLPGGIARIVDRLVEELGAERLRSQTPADASDLSDAPVVIATPAPAAARLLADVSPTASGLLSEIEYASVAQVTVELPRSGVDPVLDASGILFPRVDGKVITACTWFSTKWAHYERPDTVLLRLTSGRFGDTRAFEFNDKTLTTLLLSELSTVIDISEAPIAVRVHRWMDALPQYVPGHAARIDAIENALATDAPNIELAGAAYRGIGIPATIHSGRQAAARLLANAE